MVVLILAEFDPTDVWWIRFLAYLKKCAPQIEWRMRPECDNPEEIEIALVWLPPPGVLRTFPNLAIAIVLGSGVEGVLADPDLPDRLPLVRLVSEDKTKEMVGYVMLSVLLCQRKFIEYLELQRSRHWEYLSAPRASQFVVGILGLGVLGSAVARGLTRIGFPVRGWSRTPKTIPEVECFYGNGQFEAFLSQCRAIVCLLPGTLQTEGILCQRTLSALPRGAYIINVSRGKHLVEADLLNALASGQIAGACLDVFDREPLPENHPFWSHPRIVVTPHIAAPGQPEDFADRTLEAIECYREGKPLQYVIDRDRGY